MHFLLPSRPVSLQLVAGAGHYDAVVSAVRRAKCSVWIATANLKELLVPDERPALPRNKRGNFCSALAVFDELAQQGVELRILHAALPSGPFRNSFDKHPRLVQGGLALRLCPRVHFKVVVIDGALLYLGSANWTGAGLGKKSEQRRNFELGFTTTDHGLLDEVQGLYDRIWRGVECKACQRREVCEAPLDSY